jgi:uncharacterized membrane protein SirB2
MVESGRLHMRMWRMSITWWITKATDTLSEYVTLSAFPLQQRLQNRDSLLRYTYTVSLVSFVTLIFPAVTRRTP